jgi:hypothetical protein
MLLVMGWALPLFFFFSNHVDGKKEETSAITNTLELSPLLHSLCYTAVCLSSPHPNKQQYQTTPNHKKQTIPNNKSNNTTLNKHQAPSTKQTSQTNKPNKHRKGP